MRWLALGSLILVAFVIAQPAIAVKTANNTTTPTTGESLTVADFVKITKALNDFKNTDLKVLQEIHKQEEITQRKFIDALRDIVKPKDSSKEASNSGNMLKQDSSKVHREVQQAETLGGFPTTMMVLVITLVVILAIVAVGRR